MGHACLPLLFHDSSPPHTLSSSHIPSRALPPDLISRTSSSPRPPPNISGSKSFLFDDANASPLENDDLFVLNALLPTVIPSGQSWDPSIREESGRSARNLALLQGKSQSISQATSPTRSSFRDGPSTRSSFRGGPSPERSSFRGQSFRGQSFRGQSFRGGHHDPRNPADKWFPFDREKYDPSLLDLVRQKLQQEAKALDPHQILMQENGGRAKDILRGRAQTWWLSKHGIHPPPPQITENQRAEVEECFKLLDEDGSGSLDADELMVAFHELGFHPSRHAVNLMLRTFDNTGTGTLGFQQFVDIMARQVAAREETDPEKKARLEADGVNILQGNDMDFSTAIQIYRRAKLMEQYMMGGQMQRDVVLIMTAARRRIQEGEEKDQEDQAFARVAAGGRGGGGGGGGGGEKSGVQETENHQSGTTTSATSSPSKSRTAAKAKTPATMPTMETSSDAGHPQGMWGDETSPARRGHLHPGHHAVSRMTDLSKYRLRKLTATEDDGVKLRSLLQHVDHPGDNKALLFCLLDLLEAIHIFYHEGEGSRMEEDGSRVVEDEKMEGSARLGGEGEGSSQVGWLGDRPQSGDHGLETGDASGRTALASTADASAAAPVSAAATASAPSASKENKGSDTTRKNAPPPPTTSSKKSTDRRRPKDKLSSPQSMPTISSSAAPKETTQKPRSTVHRGGPGSTKATTVKTETNLDASLSVDSVSVGHLVPFASQPVLEGGAILIPAPKDAVARTRTDVRKNHVERLLQKEAKQLEILAERTEQARKDGLFLTSSDDDEDELDHDEDGERKKKRRGPLGIATHERRLRLAVGIVRPATPEDVEDPAAHEKESYNTESELSLISEESQDSWGGEDDEEIEDPAAMTAGRWGRGWERGHKSYRATPRRPTPSRKVAPTGLDDDEPLDPAEEGRNGDEDISSQVDGFAQEEATGGTKKGRVIASKAILRTRSERLSSLYFLPSILKDDEDGQEGSLSQGTLDVEISEAIAVHRTLDANATELIERFLEGGIMKTKLGTKGEQAKKQLYEVLSREIAQLGAMASRVEAATAADKARIAATMAAAKASQKSEAEAEAEAEAKAEAAAVGEEPGEEGAGEPQPAEESPAGDTAEVTPPSSSCSFSSASVPVAVQPVNPTATTTMANPDAPDAASDAPHAEDSWLLELEVRTAALTRAVEECAGRDWTMMSIDESLWIGKAAFAHSVQTIGGYMERPPRLNPRIVRLLRRGDLRDLFQNWADAAKVPQIPRVPLRGFTHKGVTGPKIARDGALGRWGKAVRKATILVMLGEAYQKVSHWKTFASANSLRLGRHVGKFLPSRAGQIFLKRMRNRKFVEAPFVTYNDLNFDEHAYQMQDQKVAEVGGSYRRLWRKQLSRSRLGAHVVEAMQELVVENSETRSREKLLVLEKLRRADQLAKDLKTLTLLRGEAEGKRQARAFIREKTYRGSGVGHVEAGEDGVRGRKDLPGKGLAGGTGGLSRRASQRLSQESRRLSAISSLPALGRVRSFGGGLGATKTNSSGKLPGGRSPSPSSTHRSPPAPAGPGPMTRSLRSTRSRLTSSMIMLRATEEVSAAGALGREQSLGDHGGMAGEVGLPGPFSMSRRYSPHVSRHASPEPSGRYSPPPRGTIGESEKVDLSSSSPGGGLGGSGGPFGVGAGMSSVSLPDVNLYRTPRTREQLQRAEGLTADELTRVVNGVRGAYEKAEAFNYTRQQVERELLMADFVDVSFMDHERTRKHAKAVQGLV